MDTKRGAGVEKTLINRIIFVLNVFILGVNITFALKNVKDYETISASADEQESGIPEKAARRTGLQDRGSRHPR